MDESYHNKPPIVHNRPEYSVGEISGKIKQLIEDNFGLVAIRGEISNVGRPASGHVYFDLKDDNAVLKAVCWKAINEKLRFKPEDGVEVVATGVVTTYGKSSSYQLRVESIEPAGVGAMLAILEKRRKKLKEEGLFDENVKKPIPKIPAIIGVVSSASGAVIRDIIHRINDRFPLNLILWPAKMQGEHAENEIANAIDGFNQLSENFPKPDVIIVARGGGSLEDLWCFNEEIVVRAAYNSAIPIISAIGHETDFTLLDYAADKRAPTPSAAAEIATMQISDLRNNIQNYANYLNSQMEASIKNKTQHLATMIRLLPAPQKIIANQEKSIADLSSRLHRGLSQYMNVKNISLKEKLARISPKILTEKINNQAENLLSIKHRLHISVTNKLHISEQKIAATSSLLESFNYQNILKRGFVVIRKSSEDNKNITSENAKNSPIVTKAKSLQKGDNLILEFCDGKKSAEVKSN